jgi:hypothetical protein
MMHGQKNIKLRELGVWELCRVSAILTSLGFKTFLPPTSLSSAPYIGHGG